MSNDLVPKFNGDLSEMLLKNGDKHKENNNKSEALKAYRLAGLSKEDAEKRYG